MKRTIAYYDEESGNKIGSSEVYFHPDGGSYSDTIGFQKDFGKYPNNMYRDILDYFQEIFKNKR